MADNSIVANLGSGGATFASDQIAGIEYPRAKVVWGADGTATDVSAADPMPVVQTGTPTLPTGAAAPAKQPAIGTAGASSADVISVQGIASGTAIPVSAASLPLPNGASAAAKQPALGTAGVASADVLSVQGVASMTALKVDGSGVTQPVSGTVTTSPPSNASSNVAQINGVTPLMGNGASGTGALRVSIASDSTGQVAAIGAAAHGASIAGAPVREGSRALTADFTAVTAGQVADVISTVLGKRIFLPYCLPGQAWKYVGAAGGLVNTTAITIAAAAGAGVKNYITSITLVNAHQTIGTEVVINDGAAGTAIFRNWCQFAGGGCSIKLDPPLAGSANTLLEIKEITGTATAGVVAHIMGYTAAE